MSLSRCFTQAANNSIKPAADAAAYFRCWALNSIAPISGLLGLALCVLAGPSGCAAPGCGPYSRAVLGAKALSPEYLQQLHHYVESGQCKGSCRPQILDPLKAISSRTPVIRVSPNGDARITLSFCFDQGVDLVFTDTRTPNATISVAWGSIKWKYALLWSLSQANPPN